VLVEGDDFNEPVADAVRSILDGHIILSRELGAAGHYPAIDVLSSVSRLTSDLAGTDQKNAVSKLRDAMATYGRTEDLINLGAYVAGASPKVDARFGSAKAWRASSSSPRTSRRLSRKPWCAWRSWLSRCSR
jgi:flagellum-specific ATP synthase